MEISVGYYSFFRQASGKPSEVIDIGEGTTLKGLITFLVDRYGEKFRKYALSVDDELSPMLKISWNGKLVPRLIPEWILEEGDEVKVFPPIGGG